MFETLQRLWNERGINGMTLQKLKNAVSAKRWIDEIQYKEICGEDYTA